MAKISNTSAYPLQTPANVSLADMVIITEDRTLETKNLLLADLLALQTGIVTFQEKTIEVTSAEIFTLNTTPVVLILAAGGDTSIVPHTVSIKINYGGTAYDFNINDFIEITTTSLALSGSYFTRAQTSFLNSPGAALTVGSVGSNQLVSATTSNEPLILQGSAGITAPTVGDSSITIKIQYSTIKT